MRIGIGYDSHRFCDGDHVMIGGVSIPFDKGMMAHSDGDVVLHALCDALLGAVSLGDIGQHFPDTNPNIANISSNELLRQVYALIKKEGYKVINLDATVIAEQPKLANHIPAMRKTIATTLGVDLGCVSIKATTNEKMGWIGREEGIAAQAVVLLGEC